MSITAQCGNCSAKFKAKEAMAGKRVKCPKCTQPLTIPSAEKAVAAATQKPANYNPILDLLDEAGVKSVPTGPVCDNCGEEMNPTSVICIECGYNMATGEQLATEIYDDDESLVDAQQSDASKIMAKAEKEIDESPVTAVGQDFGDGADSFIIAAIAGIGFLVLVGIGVSVVLSMDWLVETFGWTSSGISFTMAIVMALICIAWISTIAFLSNTNQGLICICSAGLYCIIFGFMQGKQLLIPTIGLIGCILIGIIAYFVGSAGEKDDFSMLYQVYETFLC